MSSVVADTNIYQMLWFSKKSNKLVCGSYLGFCGEEGSGLWGTLGAAAAPRVGNTGGGSDGGWLLTACGIELLLLVSLRPRVMERFVLEPIVPLAPPTSSALAPPGMLSSSPSSSELVSPEIKHHKLGRKFESLVSRQTMHFNIKIALTTVNLINTSKNNQLKIVN